METESDRLAMIKSLGGQLVRHDAGQFWAIFDSEFALSIDGSVESRQPALTARTSDVTDLPKDAALSTTGGDFRVKRSEPDGTGITVLVLRR